MPGSFEYQPLNGQPLSIRLIRVRREYGPDRQVQCEIKHACAVDSYICLSYVWGDEDRLHTIFINGKTFQVRHNLYRFLKQVKRTRHLLRTWIWIDALCIDQSNLSERNHQVQQMGMIFGHAKKVVSWLGDNSSIARYLEHVRQRTVSEDRARDEEIALLTDRELGPSFHDLCAAEYWNRAWITQEVVLARNITLMADNIELDRSSFPLLSHWGEGYLARLELLRPTNALSWKRKSLIYLMDKFRLKESHVRRDRVYSLLGLCAEGKDLQVDYEATDLTVAKHVLRSCKESFCLCAVDVVAFIMQLKSPDPSDLTWNDELPPFATITLPLISQDSLGALCVTKSCAHQTCNGTEQSHLQGFVVISPSSKLLSIHLHLGRICALYEPIFVRLDEVAHPPGFVGRWSPEGSAEAELTEFTVRDHDCSMRLRSNGTSYKVKFSFDLLVKLAQLGRDFHSGLCKRVADLRTPVWPPNPCPELRLISWDRSHHVLGE